MIRNYSDSNKYRLENIFIKTYDLVDKVKMNGDFEIKVNNGIIKFEVNGKTYNKKGEGNCAYVYQKKSATLYNVTCKDTTGKIKYKCVVNYTKNNIFIEDFKKYNNVQMEIYLLKIFDKVLVDKLKCRKRKKEMFFNQYEYVYYNKKN